MTPWARRGNPSSLYPATTDKWRVVHQGIGGAGGGVGGGKGSLSESTGAAGPQAPRQAATALDFRVRTQHHWDAEWLTLGNKEGQLFDGDVQVSKITILERTY